MSKKRNLYLGKAGQFIVMSELLFRGWNVAIPEVDVGDDIFVVRDANGQLIRVQVKTATGKRNSNAVSAQFSINLAQLQVPVEPLLVYAFVIRIDDAWQKLIIVRQDKLLEEYQFNQIGSVSGNNLVLTFLLTQSEVVCSRIDFSKYRHNFDDFPMIHH